MFNSSLLEIPKVSTRGKSSNTAADMGWMNVIYSLSNGEFLKRTEVLLQPIDETFTWLIYDNRRQYDEAVYYKSLNK